MEKPVILIAIPAYGANIMVPCFMSIVSILKDKDLHEKYDLQILTVHNEALISRARQEIAKRAIERNVDKLFFIDADISFTVEQFKAILESGKQTGKLVVGGTYLKKSLADPALNYGFSLDEEKAFVVRQGIPSISLPGFKLLKQDFCRDSPLLKVKYVPTGFLCIDRKVLQQLHEQCPKYLSARKPNNEVILDEDRLKEMLVAEMFPVSVQDGSLESEDWGFCRLCEENNIEVFLHTDVVVTHHGLIDFHPRHFQEE